MSSSSEEGGEAKGYSWKIFILNTAASCGCTDIPVEGFKH